MRRPLLALACAAAFAGPAPKTEGQKLNALLDRYWEEVLKRNPVTATAIGDPRYNALFPNDLTAKARAEEKAWEQAWLKRLESLHRDRSGLSDCDRAKRRF